MADHQARRRGAVRRVCLRVFHAGSDQDALHIALITLAHAVCAGIHLSPTASSFQSVALAIIDHVLAARFLPLVADANPPWSMTTLAMQSVTIAPCWMVLLSTILTAWASACPMVRTCGGGVLDSSWVARSARIDGMACDRACLNVWLRREESEFRTGCGGRDV